MTEDEAKSIAAVFETLLGRIVKLEAAHEAWGRVLAELANLVPLEFWAVLGKYPDYCEEAEEKILIWKTAEAQGSQLGSPTLPHFRRNLRQSLRHRRQSNESVNDFHSTDSLHTGPANAITAALRRFPFRWVYGSRRDPDAPSAPSN